MASPHKALPRRLFEVLEEQQEPFVPDACLLDHGFSERIVQFEATFSRWRPGRKRGGGFWWPGCLPAAKLGCWGGIKRALNWHGRAPCHGRWSIPDCFAEARSTGLVGVGGGGGGFHRLYCSGATAEWREYELSPVSVLDVHSDEEEDSVHNHSMEGERRPSYDLDSATEVGMVGLAPLPLFKETSVALPEESNCAWESQCGDLALVTNLVNLELENWSHSQVDQKREIGIEIEGFILEELRDECVLDML